jgi:trimethylamine--corrinoid protein Co-methyltransferase
MLEILSQDEIQKIHLATFEVLETVGVMFEHDAALKIFEQAGAVVDSKRRIVRIPEYLVNEALKKTPSQVIFLARDKKYNLRIGGKRVHFTNGYGAIYVLDPQTGERRHATLRDLENFTLLCDALPCVHYVMTHCIPQDIPREVVDRYMAFAMLKNTSKHCCLTALTLEGAKAIIKMGIALVGGEEEFRKKSSIINSGICPVSPLLFPYDLTARLIEFSKYKVPLELVSGVIAGATGPVTIAGTLVQANAEDLAALVLSQLINPGTPLIYGTMATIMDMKYATYAYGAPELALINAAFAQIAHYYNLPYFGTAGTIDSKLPDEQAAYECAISNVIAALAGSEVIHDGVYGILESARTASYEQLIISHEIVSMVTRILNGINIDDEKLAIDVIRNVGPGGNYLREIKAVQHTSKHILQEHWQPLISDRSARSEWELKGSKDIVIRAKEKVQEILATHKPEPLDKEIEIKLKEIVKEAHNPL